MQNERKNRPKKRIEQTEITNENQTENYRQQTIKICIESTFSFFARKNSSLWRAKLIKSKKETIK